MPLYIFGPMRCSKFLVISLISSNDNIIKPLELWPL
uniref:Uncharacterized protein n=1 Tax=Rhizophora mucronata TaxID=61149 RepID=A0A2P2Q3K5_RHIMU